MFVKDQNDQHMNKKFEAGWVLILNKNTLGVKKCKANQKHSYLL